MTYSEKLKKELLGYKAKYYEMKKQKERQKDFASSWEVMTPANVKKIEDKTSKLMEIDNEAEEIKSKATFNKAQEYSAYKQKVKELLEKEGINSLDPMYYQILEDANYHTLNHALEDLKIFPDFKGDYSKGDDAYHQYRAKGGKTWEL
jgi:hypothetical protein